MKINWLSKLYSQYKGMATLVLIFVFLCVLPVVAIITLEKELKEALAQELNNTLQTNVESLNLWAESEKELVEFWANEPRVRSMVTSMLERSELSDTSDFDWLATNELKTLRDILRPVSRVHDYIGFVVIDRQGNQIAALLDEPVGQSTLHKRSDFVERALAGNSVITLPFLSDVKLPDRHGVYRPSWPTMFSASPIYNARGETVAVLSFRLRPEVTFSRVMETSRRGDTGETYAFDSSANMLSSSRFTMELKQTGLIPNTPESHSILHVQLRNPGGSLLNGFKSTIPRDDQPLTLLARSAVLGQSGFDVDGYRDYRGEFVVGTWTWVDELGFGLGTEIDLKEAYQSLIAVRQYMVCILLLLIIAAIISVRLRSREIKHRMLLVKSEQREKQIVDAAFDGIITTSVNRQIQTVNMAAARIFGCENEALLGRQIDHLFPKVANYKEKKDIHSFVENVHGGEVGESTELFGRRMGGSIFPADLAVTFLPEQDVFVFILRDISDRKKAEYELLNAKALAEESNQVKTQFLANMSHEIRTPMNGLLGMLQIAMQSEMGAKTRNYLLKAKSSASSLLGVINDILDVSKIDAGKLELESSSFDVEELVNHAIHICALDIERKGLELLLFFSPSLPRYLVGDPLRIRQVLINLLSNAAKFTHNGEIQISCNHEKESGEDVLHVSVIDSGIGMTEDQRLKLFEPFSQADSSMTRKYGGTGLGLTISKQIVELMGGRIWSESRLGEGSAFHFTLPLIAANDQKPVSIHWVKECSEIRILIVDDNQQARELCQGMVNSFGFTTEVADSGSQALEELDRAQEENAPFDLMVLDWKMPDINGLDVVRCLHRKIKDGAQLQLPKVVVLTGHSVEMSLSDFDAGLVDTILTKPATPSDLYDALIDSLGEGVCKRLLSDEAKEDIELGGDLTGCRVLLVEDNSINQEVAAEFLRTVGFEVDIANHGGEAIQKVRNANYDAVLMDIQMPVMDGYTATDFIRNIDGLEDLPIIALTAHSMVGDREKVIAVGMNDYVTKPIDFTHLISVLRRHIGGGARAAKNGVSIEFSDKPYGQLLSNSGVDFQFGYRQCGSDLVFYRKMLNQFREAYCDAGKQLVANLRDGCRDESVSLIHDIGSLSGTLGGSDLHRVSSTLEEALLANSEDLDGLVDDFVATHNQLILSIDGFMAEFRGASKLGANCMSNVFQ